MFEDERLNRLIYLYTPLYAEDFPIILFWIPKSGCTTLNRWFFFQNPQGGACSETKNSINMNCTGSL
ncbi:hypothetical protein DT075_36330 [Bacillus licheniformis]|nr:hypothetical protein DT075_36330 [Bacillus licheniformis]